MRVYYESKKKIRVYYLNWEGKLGWKGILALLSYLQMRDNIFFNVSYSILIVDKNAS